MSALSLVATVKFVDGFELKIIEWSGPNDTPHDRLSSRIASWKRDGGFYYNVPTNVSYPTYFPFHSILRVTFAEQ